MYLHKIDIENFRLLEKVDLFIEKKTTVIVGRNNSGKTSLTELFRGLLLANTPRFQLEDFSISVHEQFLMAFDLKRNGREEDKIRAVLPVIKVVFTLRYDDDTVNLGPLSDFIIDLNPDCTETLIVIRYELEDGKINALFDDLELKQEVSDEQLKSAFYRAIKERVPKLYTASLQAVDPNDLSNEKSLEMSKLRVLLQSGFIDAQRGLDDKTHTPVISLIWIGK